MNIQEAIVEFAKREREEAEKAKENERNIASRDPESYIAKEIKYQTALLHAISEEVYQIKKAIEKNEGLCSSLRKKFVIFKSKRWRHKGIVQTLESWDD